MAHQRWLFILSSRRRHRDEIYNQTLCSNHPARRIGYVLDADGVFIQFLYVTQERLERRFEALATSIDQAMLLQPLQAQDNWLPLVMRPLGIVAIHVDTETSNLFSYSLPTIKAPWASLAGYRQTSLTMMHHPAPG